MMLGKRHGSGVEPAVDHLRHPLHLFSALGADHSYIVNVGAVKLNVVGTVVGHALKLRNASDGVLVAALTLPNIKGSTPVTVSGNPPVLDILQPVAETALSNGIRHPVDGIIVADQVLFHRCHLDEPGLSGVVQKGRAAAPTVGIAVFKGGSLKEQAYLFQIL